MPKWKGHISFLFAFALLIGTAWQTVTVVHFYMNREAITATYCVNKDQPQLNCKGQCHLQKQLQAATPDQEEKQHTTNAKTALLYFVFANTSEAEQPIFQSTRCTNNFANKFIKTNAFIADIFDPPEYSPNLV